MKRGTGRTTRMLRSAAEQAREGAYVFVAAGNAMHADNLLRHFLAQEKNDETLRHIVSCRKVYIGAGSISFETTDRFDWDRLRYPGAHPSCLTFVDHWTIEDRYARILQALHEWDALEAK